MEWEGNTYILVETTRYKDSERIEGCVLSYVMGVKRVEKSNDIIKVEGISNVSINSGSLPSISSLSTSVTTNSTGLVTMGGFDNEIESRFKMEQDKLTERSREMVEMGKKGNDELRKELKGEMMGMSDTIALQNAKQDEKMERMMGMMMQMMKATAENNER